MANQLSNELPVNHRTDTCPRGSLLVVGSGIQWGGHATLATQRAIEIADRVLFAVADPWAARWIRSLNPTAESLPYPTESSSRQAIYREMTERILDAVRQGRRVCAVFYGSPAVLAQAAHAAVRQAVDEGFPARMLPAISFLECLFTDLGIDPGEAGFQMLDAGVCIRTERPLDARSHLVISQVALINKRGVFREHDDQVTAGLRSLSQCLQRFYPPGHVATFYECATHPLVPPSVSAVPIGDLHLQSVSAISTLYVPPLSQVAARAYDRQFY